MLDDESGVVASWEIDPTSSPQFGATLELRRKGTATDSKPIATVDTNEPHARSVQIPIEGLRDSVGENLRLAELRAVMRFRDIFGRQSSPVAVSP